MKKLLSVIISAATAISALGGTCFADGGLTINGGTDVIWKNGGQYTYGDISADNRYVNYEIVTDSTLKFATFTKAGESEAPLSANPFYGTVDKSGNAVSKVKEDTAVKLWAADTDGNVASIDNIEMKVAPSAVFLFDKSESDNTAKKLVQAELAMGESVSAYVVGTAGSAYTLSPDISYNCYVAEEYSEYVTASMTVENNQYRVDVTALIFEAEKKTDAKVVVYNEQSGKKAVLSLKIDNSVTGVEISADQYAVSKDGSLLSCIFMDSAAKAESRKTVNVTALTSTNLDTTDTPEVFVIGNDSGYNFSINSRGVFKPDLAKKSQYVTAKLKDGSKTEVELTAKKGTPDNTAAWIAVVYNTDGYKDLAEGEAPAGVVIFKVIVGGEEWKTDLSGTVARNGKPAANVSVRLYTDDGSGSYNEPTDYTAKSTIKTVKGEKAAYFTFKNVPAGTYKAKTDPEVGYSVGVSDKAIGLTAPVQNYDGSYPDYDGAPDFGELNMRSIRSVNIDLFALADDAEVALGGADVALYSTDLTENTDDYGNLSPFAVSVTDSRGNATFKDVPACDGYYVAAKSENMTASSVTSRSNRYTAALFPEDSPYYETVAEAIGAGRSNLSAIIGDSDGTTLENASVILGIGGAENFRPLKAAIFTNENGEYLTDYKPGLENGDYTLKLEANDCVVTYFDLTLSETDANGTVDLGDISLDKVIYTVSGTIKQGTSVADVSSVSVILTDADGGETEEYPDGDGVFSFGELPAGSYTVAVPETYQSKAISSPFTVGGKPQTETEVSVNASLRLIAHDGSIAVSLPNGFDAEVELSSDSLGGDLLYKVAKSSEYGYIKFVFSGLPPAEDYVVSCSGIVNQQTLASMELSYDNYTSAEINVKNNSKSCYPKFRLY